MKKDVVLTALIFALALWQCSKIDQGNNLNLKESLDKSVAKINTAFEKISASKGYQLLSVSEASAKSDYDFHDSIDLKLIAGVYEFSPDSIKRHNFYFPFRLFTKTSASDKFIVNLPQSLVFHPKHLHFFDFADSVLKNDFTITASDYHFYYTFWNAADYKLNADFSLNSDNIGNLDMISTWKSGSDNKFSTNFTFPEGYSIIKSGQTGDTTDVMFALAKENDTLLKEDVWFAGEGFRRMEHRYTLEIGNVAIVRASGIDSIQVFLNGVLQKKAAAKIENNDDYNSSICSHRDILLTFDDGTTAKLSDLLSPALTTLKSLSQALGEMYISKHIIDYIAMSIYFNTH
jgi:hypothetical protein